MIAQSWLRRLRTRGVLWRRLLRWGVFNIPVSVEPIMIGFWSLMFLLWTSGRTGIMHNLAAIKPGSNAITNLCRAWRVLWNYAWTVSDNGRFRELQIIPDWEFTGLEYFEALQSQAGGAILLTAHMGSYDLGAHLFSEQAKRSIVMVRAPEIDPETGQFEQRLSERGNAGDVRVGFNTGASDLAFELLDELRRGNIIAIQGDRVTPGISTMPATLFGRKVELPAGPFALSMAAGAPIYPLFVIRSGRRRYRLITLPPILVTRRGRDRQIDLQAAMNRWAADLEQVIADHWFQWFNFEPFDPIVPRTA